MNDNPLADKIIARLLFQPLVEELRPILARVRAAKETLGRDGPDCAYEANKQLEVVASRLSDLIKGLEQ